jgi:hypothetical protein
VSVRQDESPGLLARQAKTPEGGIPHHGQENALDRHGQERHPDRHSLGCYRRIAERCPPHLIYETLGLVKEMAREGRVRESRGALFVSLMKRRSAAL